MPERTPLVEVDHALRRVRRFLDEPIAVSLDHSLVLLISSNSGHQSLYTSGLVVPTELKRTTSQLFTEFGEVFFDCGLVLSVTSGPKQPSCSPGQFIAEPRPGLVVCRSVTLLLEY